jgi:hypothetical protein
MMKRKKNPNEGGKGKEDRRKEEIQEMPKFEIMRPHFETNF